jgi:uncharacterized protein YcbK (DUF882 family)
MEIADSNWMMICPPKNWREPVTISEEQLSLLSLISKRLSLVMTRDDARKKIYLGNALASGATTPNGVRYPSGWTADVVSDSDAGAEYKSVDPAMAAPLIRTFPDAQISKNFRLSEFRPGRHSYEYIRLSPALVLALEEIRTRAGRPVTVTSGYRPPDYNREVGGVSNSCHIDGLAADIYCDGLTTDQLYDICVQVIGYRGGVGYYPKSGFIHVDLRGYEARWSGT